MGKHVASVQHLRRDGQRRYMFKDAGDARWQEMSRDRLYEELGALKERLGDQLYVKIVIPDDSGLTYNEAWDFTKEILSRYDYYYKDGWPGAETSAPADQ